MPSDVAEPKKSARRENQADIARLDPGTGRTNQKERTRQALVAAARELIAADTMPTMASVAGLAKVSLATAYRYYPDPRALMRDTLSPRWPGLEEIVSGLSEISDVAERARRGAEAMARHVLGQERTVRALIAASYQPDQADPPGQMRPAFRTRLVAAVLDGCPACLDAAERRRLEFALSAVISAEAVLSLKDIGAEEEEIIRTLGWMAAEIASACAQT